jgi:hypothetical protein
MKHNDLMEVALLTKDETRILSWSSDHTLRLWDAGWPKGNLLASACTLLMNHDIGQASKHSGDRDPCARLVFDRARAIRLTVGLGKQLGNRPTTSDTHRTGGRGFSRGTHGTIDEELLHHTLKPLGEVSFLDET